MKPNYVIKKSVVAVLSFWLIIFCWLIIPAIIQIVLIIQAKKETVEIYNDKIVQKGGILNTYENESSFFGVYSVSVHQSLWGKIFNYGNLIVDCPGNWDVGAWGIKNPNEAKKFLASKIVARNTAETNTVFALH